VLQKYAANVQNNSITKGCFTLMALGTGSSLLFTIAGTPDAVLASHTLCLNALQYAPDEVRGHAELICLALAGRTVLNTAAHQAASTWREYRVSSPVSQSLRKLSTPELKVICGATLIENTS
jgi:hypothetical protein